MLRPAFAAALALVLAGCQTKEMFSFSERDRTAGKAALKAGDEATATAKFEKATTSNPRDYQSFLLLGQQYAKQGDTQRAANAYRLALRSRMTTDQGRADPAHDRKVVAAYADLVATSPSPEAMLARLEQEARTSQTSTDWLLLAQSYARVGDADAAIDAYNRASIAGPSDAALQKEYGLYLAQLGQTARAEPVLRKAYQLDPTDAEVEAGLRQVGVVPGPSLLPENQLARPVMPRGPLPELGNGSRPTGAASTQ